MLAEHSYIAQLCPLQFELRILKNERKKTIKTQSNNKVTSWFLCRVQPAKAHTVSLFFN